MTRAVAGACGLAVATGWNVANTGAIAQALAAEYGVGLAAIGLLTTALFVVHLVVQIPGGRASDRFGPKRMGMLGLALLALCNGLALLVPSFALGMVMRSLMGIGTGLAFVAGADYVRAQGASASAQGLFGGAGVAGGGLALAVVPQVEDWLGWRAPYATAAIVALAALAALAAAPGDVPRSVHLHEGAAPPGIFRDVRLYRLGLMYAATFGLSVVVGNWVATLLERGGGQSQEVAGAVAALTLLLGHRHAAARRLVAAVAAGVDEDDRRRQPARLRCGRPPRGGRRATCARCPRGDDDRSRRGSALCAGLPGGRADAP